MIRSLRSAVLALALVVRAQHEKDTFNLGDGPAIRAALVRWFRVQKQHTLAYLHHLPGHRADGPTELPSKLPNFDGERLAWRNWTKCPGITSCTEVNRRLPTPGTNASRFSCDHAGSGGET